MTTKKPKLWLVISDLHFREIHKPTWNAALAFIRRNKKQIVGFAFLGDQFDNADISRFNASRPGLWTVGSYKKDTDDFARQILKPLESALPKKCQKVWLIGNHDARERLWFEQHPQFSGMERPELLNLVRKGWKVIEQGKTFRIGKLTLVHGDLFPGYTPVCPAKRAVEAFTASVLQGHTHSPQSFTRVSPIDNKQTWMGYVSPAACELNPAYMLNKPSAWSNGLTIVETRNNGNFNCYICITDRKTGEFSWGGVTYGK